MSKYHFFFFFYFCSQIVTIAVLIAVPVYDHDVRFGKHQYPIPVPGISRAYLGLLDANLLSYECISKHEYIRP